MSKPAPPENELGAQCGRLRQRPGNARRIGQRSGFAESRISALKRRGVIQAARPRKNEFHLGPAVRGYLQYKCGCASESEADYHRERALKEKANLQLREILMEQTRDQLHDAQAV